MPDVNVQIRMALSGAGAQQAVEQLRQIVAASGNASAALGNLSGSASRAESAFGGFLKASLVMEALKTAGDVMGRVGGMLESVGAAAFNSIRDYESLTLSMQQLTASQILQAGSATNMADALYLAAQPAKELVNWTEQLAIHSPFTSAQIARAIQLAEGFQFVQDEAKRLTQDLVDLASTKPGAGQDFMANLTDAFGKINVRGKVTLEDLNRVMEAGVPTLDILAKAFGTTRMQMSDMITQGVVPSQRAIKALMDYIEQNYGGAAERMTKTWQGLTSSLQDIKDIDLRTLFGGVAQQFQPELAKLVDYLSSDEFRGRLEQIGSWLAEGVRAGMDEIRLIMAPMFADDGPFGAIKKALTGGGMDTGAIRSAFTDVISALANTGNEVLKLTEEFVLLGKTIVGVLEEIKLHWQGGAPNQMVRTFEGAAVGAGQYWEEIKSEWQNRGNPNYTPAWPAGNPATTVVGGPGIPAENQNSFEARLNRILADYDARAAIIADAQRNAMYPAGGMSYATPTGAAPGAPPSPWDFAKNLPIASVQIGKKAEDGIVAGGKKLAEQIQKAFDEAAKNVSDALKSGAEALKKLWPEMPGAETLNPAEDPNGPFARLRRVMDIAKNGAAAGPDQPGYWKKDKNNQPVWVPPKQTQEWMKEENLTPGQALPIAQAAVNRQWLAPGVFERVDWAKLGEVTKQQTEAATTEKYAGQAVVALQAAGKPITQDSMRDMIDQLKKQDTDQQLTFANLKTAVDSLGDGNTLKDVVNALGNILAKIGSPLPTPPGPAPAPGPTGNTNPPPTSSPKPGMGGVPPFAKGTLSAPGGLALVGELGPEIIDLPRGSRVHTAQQTRQMIDQEMFAKAVERQVSTADLEKRAAAVADRIIGIAQLRTMQGMLAAAG
jgi:tape measure domain-containing protein